MTLKREELDDLDREILAAVVACGADAYGRMVYIHVAEHGRRWTPLSGIYLRLQRMETLGLVRSWEMPGGPERGYRPKRYWAIVDVD